MLQLLPFDRQLQRKNQQELASFLNRKAGKGNWFWTFRCGKQLYSYNWGFQLYEDAYWSHLRSNIDIVKLLVSHHDTYVWDRYDLESGLEFSKQNQKREHFPDIAIRRALVRLGVSFKGKELLRIPGSDLSDTKIPFHLPHLVGSDKSIRSWLNNRIIAIAPDIEGKGELANILIK